MSDKTLIKQPANDAEISIKDLVIKIKEAWKFLLTKWKTILIAGLIGGVIGLCYSLYKKPVYTAELSFALEDEKSSGGLGGALGLASQFGLDVSGQGGGAFAGDNLIELMKSRSMVEKTLLTKINISNKDQTLAELYISFNNLRLKWQGKPELESIRFLPEADRSKFSLKQDSVLGVFYNDIIKKNLLVDKTDKKLSIIKVIVNSENELFSKYFAEILAKTVSDFYIDTKTKKSVLNVSILQHQTDSVRRELNSAINGVASSIDETPNANPNRQLLRAPSQHRQVDVQANQAILTELVKNLEISKVSLRKETPLIQIIDLPILPLGKERTGKLKGIVVGAFIVGLLALISLIIGKVYRSIMN